jgi:hypothetical protein
MPGTGIEGRACFDNLPRASILGATRLVRIFLTLELSPAFLCHRSVAAVLQCIRAHSRVEHFANMFSWRELLFDPNLFWMLSLV